MIAIVTPRPLGRGGTSVETCAWQLARRLASRFPVALVCPGRRSVPGRAGGVGGRLRVVRVPGGPGPDGRRLLRAALRLRPALVQVENRPTWVLALRRLGYRGPVVLHLHSVTFLAPARVPAGRARAALRAADALAVPSERIRRLLAARFGATAGRAVVIPGGVDPERFRPVGGEPRLAGERSRLRARWGAGRRPVLLFAGRVVPGKGLPVLLRACAALRRRGRRFLLVVAGGPRPGPGARGHAGTVWRLARRARVAVRFLGPVPHGRMPAVYRAADAVAVPSQGEEAFGLVNVEAMACGLPVVAARVGGIPEVVRDGVDGLLVRPPGRVAAWVRALDAVLADPALRRRLGEAGRRRAREAFTWDRGAAALARLYEALLRRGGRPAGRSPGPTSPAPAGAASAPPAGAAPPGGCGAAAR